VGSTRHFPGEALKLSRRDTITILFCIGAITALSWTYLISLSRQMSALMEYDAMMAQMGMAGSDASNMFNSFAMWAVMMIGMMSPAAAPVLLLFWQARVAREGRRGIQEVFVFGLGYFAIWTAFSAVAAAVQWALHQATILSPQMSASSPVLAGAVLVAAGLYQLTAFKIACLSQCRSPLGFLMTNWRDGISGAFNMGARHGLFCLGCCWALMLVLFAVGVMNLGWIAALMIIVLIEKTGIGGAIVPRITGFVLLFAGIAFMTL
jgi:predicted metal-binding membrane protein